MKISLQWLSDYVDLPSPEELAKKLTFAGLEVEAQERPAAAVEGVVVAQIVESRPHPNAEKLSVTQVDAGPSGKLQVVCGAKNYKVGDKVPLATVGTKLPNGAEISKAQLRGVDSFGMLCSARELGLSSDASGLMILDPGAPVGQPLAKALGLDDLLFEINVTPNRSDALSHLGIAREVAVLTGQKVRWPQPRLQEGATPTQDRVQIRIEDPARCLRYAARVVEGVTIGPSPAWLAQKLERCGVRAINNVVDVTNFVLLEYGQPLHAFDLDRVAGGQIVVRRAKPNEKLTTLDGKERALDPDDLLICDRQAPQALAGVMGGGPSEVSPKTTRILIESATFEPGGIRRASKRHGLHTEASHRFERGADVGAAVPALERAAALIAELGKGTVLQGTLDVHAKLPPAKKVGFRFLRAGEVLGMALPRSEAAAILQALGFTPLEERADQAVFQVPSWRVDVEREEDLIEEVARIRGYDSIPPVLPHGMDRLEPEPPVAEAERRMRNALAGAGFDEVLNYAFVSPKQLDALGDERPRIGIKNALSADQSVMRTTLLASLLQNAVHAARHQAQTVRLYELGRTYLPDPEGGQGRRPVALEQHVVAGVLVGHRQERSWTAKDQALDFYDAKGAVECVLHALSVRDVSFVSAQRPYFHPRMCAELQRGGHCLGAVGALHPKVAKRLELEAPAFAFELDAEALLQAAALVPGYRPISRYPAVLRDLAVVVPASLQAQQVRRVILEVGGQLVEDATVFDVYEGKPLPEGKKNLAFALRYRAPDRTLKDDEVNAAHARIVAEVNARLGASLRA